jgi:replicative DNA helicase
VSQEVAERYRVELQLLARSLLDEAEAARLAEAEELLVLDLGEAAAALLRAFEAEVEPRLAADSGDLGHVADWASKLVGAVARIAGLLHLAEHLHSGFAAPVTAPTVEAAIAIGRYLIEHALAAFGLMGSDQTLDDARYVLGRIERTTTERFTRRELFTALPRGRFPKVDALDPALELLEAHGHIRRADQPAPKGPGRPPSPAYEVNPLGRPGVGSDDPRRWSR